MQRGGRFLIFAFSGQVHFSAEIGGKGDRLSRDRLGDKVTRRRREGVTGKPQVSDFGEKGISDCRFDGVKFKSFSLSD